MVTRLLAACGGFGLAVYLAFAPMSPAGAYESTSGEALHQACGGAAPHVCLSYLAGIIDLHQAGLAGGEVPLFCPENAPPEKVGRGVWLYYEQHPDALELPAALGAVPGPGADVPVPIRHCR
ncbi:MAG TPA: hypothetical protein EYM34_07395, partial [Alphaproteobacteria bacterium]|nr:hypothetical protein [Alphaproteobacteria bacterium]